MKILRANGDLKIILENFMDQYLLEMLFGDIRSHYRISHIQVQQYHPYCDETIVSMLIKVWKHQSPAGIDSDKDIPKLQVHTHYTNSYWNCKTLAT